MIVNSSLVPFDYSIAPRQPLPGGVPPADNPVRIGASEAGEAARRGATPPVAEGEASMAPPEPAEPLSQVQRLRGVSAVAAIRAYLADQFPARGAWFSESA